MRGTGVQTSSVSIGKRTGSKGGRDIGKIYSRYYKVVIDG